VASPGSGPPRRRQGEAQPRWVLRLLASSRYFVLIAVVGAFLAGVTLLVYATLAVVKTIWDAISDGDLSIDGAKHLEVDFVELIDVFLLGTVLIIVGLGLYELFIESDLPVPAWLRVDDLDQLKGKLVGAIVVLLGVSFLASVVDWNGSTSILDLGIAIALVVAAFALLNFVTSHPPQDDQ